MDKKKLRLYIILLVLILAAVLMLPFGINSVTDVVVGKILKTTQTEGETEIESESDETESEETEAEEVETEETEFLYETASESETAAKGKKAKKKQENTAAGAQASSEAKSDEDLQQQNDQEEEMKRFTETFSPEITVLDGAADSYGDFLKGRESHFLQTFGEYLYSYYGEMVDVTEIELIETVRNNEDECSCQVRAYAGEESEIFICSYNKKQDYYGVYASYVVE